MISLGIMFLMLVIFTTVYFLSRWRLRYIAATRSKRVTKIAFDFDSTLTVGHDSDTFKDHPFGSPERINVMKRMLKACYQKGWIPYLVSSATYGWIEDRLREADLDSLFEGIYCRAISGYPYQDWKTESLALFSNLYSKHDVYRHLSDNILSGDNMVVVDDDYSVVEKAHQDGFKVHLVMDGHCGKGLSHDEMKMIGDKVMAW